MALPVSTNYLHSCPILLKYGDLVTGQFLVSGLDHFLVGPQVKPKLQTDRIFILGGWHLSMHDPFSSSHPLDITRPNYSLMSFEILVKDPALFHVSDSFESAMRVVRETSRQPHFKIVEHQEWVKTIEILVTNDSKNLGSDTLPLPRRREHVRHCVSLDSKNYSCQNIGVHLILVRKLLLIGIR